MFASPAYASAGAAPSGTTAFLVQMFPLLAIFAFFILRDVTKRNKEQM